jgi:hypothetical protein
MLKYTYLQAFCKLWKPTEKYRTSLTRRGSLVRLQHRLLNKSCALQEKHNKEKESGDNLSSF